LAHVQSLDTRLFDGSGYEGAEDCVFANIYAENSTTPVAYLWNSSLLIPLVSVWSMQWCILI